MGRSLAKVAIGSQVEEWGAVASVDEPVAARVTPEQKVQLVKSLQQQGHVVAVVGDGLNDAPMLAAADFPVAVSQATPVTKSAAACLLMRSNLLDFAELLDCHLQQRPS